MDPSSRTFQGVARVVVNEDSGPDGMADVALFA
jgi:hypothetical protein